MNALQRIIASWCGLLPRRPQGHPPHVFTDHLGTHYYGWSDFANLPPARANEVDDIMLQIDAGLSHATLGQLSGAISDAISKAMELREAKAKTNALAKANALALELKARPSRIMPRECYYALAAVCCVRADEDPYAFDPSIQAEKMQTFREAAEAGHSFFTQSEAFAKLLGVTHCSSEGFSRLSIAWSAQEARTAAMLRL